MDLIVSHDALVDCLYGLANKKPAKFDITEEKAKIIDLSITMLVNT